MDIRSGYDEDEKAQARADHDPPPSSKAPHVKRDDDDDDDDEDKGTEPSGKCANCGSANEDNSKFCDQCGKSLAAAALDDDEDDDDEDDDDEDDDEDKMKSAAHPPPPDRMSASATLASILGASSESPLAIKTAAIKLRQVVDTARGITGKSEPEEIVGALLAVPAKLAKGARVVEDLAKIKAKQEDAERRDLCDRLVKVNPGLRSKVLADVVTEGGERTGVRIRKRYAEMNLAVLRGLVTDLEGNTPKQRRNPFEPDQERARVAARAGANGTREERIQRAMGNPVVQNMANRVGALPLKTLAEQYVNNDFDLPGARA